MGRDSEALCMSCRERHYLGECGANNWLDGAASVEEWDRQAAENPDAATLHCNQLYRRFLVEHAGHDIKTFSSDSISEDEPGLLRFDGSGGHLYADVRGFKEINEAI